VYSRHGSNKKTEGEGEKGKKNNKRNFTNEETEGKWTRKKVPLAVGNEK
jgi:hypothetical protein